jgi:uncharacterized protein (DUF58 family)
LTSLQSDAEQLAAPLPPLLVEAERIAATVVQGVHGRRRVGTGEAFWQFRRYGPEDPASAIDWRQSAKSQHLFVRENEWEAAESVWFWRDASPSMNYRSDLSKQTKVERATLLVLALASLLVRAGERIALLGESFPPASGRVPLRRIAHTLTTKIESAGDLPPETNLPRYAKVIVIVDCIAPIDSIANFVTRHSGRGVSGHILQVLDPVEEDLPFSGRIRFEGIEDARDLTFGRTENIRTAYRDRLAAHRAAIADVTGRHGWTFSMHRTDRSASAALLALYGALSVKRSTMMPVGAL